MHVIGSYVVVIKLINTCINTVMNCCHVNFLVFTVKSPGPPTNLKTRTTAHAIIVTWQPPIEKTLPITSYVIHYKVLPNGHAYRIVVGNAIQRFSVNTGSVEGKLLTFCVAASIGDLLGTASKNVYVRARTYFFCRDRPRVCF